ncbi:MAG TPA: lysylphosphatidylglycerol synthase transmembrane domain-containing protein [Polyangia bacterium]|nr:lysylphosphatidylglycerol synthase transmembrane domain-containing protein [Polyangia bacterium]
MKLRVVAISVLGVVVSAAGFLFAFWRVQLHGGLHVVPRVHLADLRAALGGVQPVWLCAFAALNVSTLILRSFQTQSLVRRKDGTEPRWRAAWQSVTVGMMMQNILPARLSEAARVVALVRADDVRASTVTGALVLGRILDLAALLIVTCVPSIALGLAAANTRAMHIFAAVGSIVAAAMVALLVVFYRRRAATAAWAHARGKWLGHLVEGFADGLSALGSPARLVEASLSTLAIPIALAATYGSALFAFGLGGLPTGTTLVLVAAILFAIAIPSAPSSVGVFHAVATWTLTALGAAPARAAAFALVTHAIGVVTFIGLGAIALSELGGRAALREPRVQ